MQTHVETVHTLCCILEYTLRPFTNGKHKMFGHFSVGDRD
jgi:hypothetical protein